ncbi:transmembrane sensor [Pedobacter sp. UYP30]|uniref:FecR family protein n=1 Tax=Pedobacter sp. UYP30 TaxID=1756400 RepID=UPI003395643B
MNELKLRRLLHQYLNNNIGREDCIELLNYLKDADDDKIDELIDVSSFDLDEGQEFGKKQSMDLLSRIKSDPRFEHAPMVKAIPLPTVRKFYQRKWIKVAAAAIVLLTTGLLFFQHERYFTHKSDTSKANNNKVVAILPGGKKATLTMTNGQSIALNNVANGILAKTNAGNVVKTNTGEIVYKNASNPTTMAGLVYNTLSTPKGGEYQVVLPDGTKVWLNSASSITYPTAFNNKERRVKLIGEAYFEVAKNKKLPFYVNVNNAQIRVLGTHFNIAAYSDDEEMTTTLLEGSVQLTKNDTHSMLKPGQKAVINNNTDNIVVSQANIEDAVAWKNGYFVFDNNDINGVMKKISRWYDVTVDYRADLSDQKFGGTFYRSKSIVELLQYLEKIGKIKFTIEGRRIIVMK